MFLRIFFSFIGILAGFSACIAFFIMKNYQASMWGFLSGVLSALLLHIHRLKCKNRIADYYTSSALWSLGWFGYAGFAIGISGFIYNTIIFLYLHIPIMPVEESAFISMMWCVLTAKCGFLLFWFARSYSHFVDTVSSREPLLRQRQRHRQPEA